MRAKEFVTDGWWSNTKDHFDDPDHGWYATNAFDTTRDLIGGIRNKFRSKLKEPVQPPPPVPTQQPVQPSVPKPQKSSASVSSEPEVVPQDTAGPSRNVRVHPYKGMSFSYDVIKNQWSDNRTDKPITDPELIRNINISYNKANQRPTLYNMTPADRARIDRERKQRAAVGRINQELGR